MVVGYCKNCNTRVERYGNKPPVFCSRDCKASFESKDIDLSRLVSLYERGLSLKETADEVGLSWQRVQQLLKKSGVNLRGNTDHLHTDKNPTKGKPRSQSTKKKLRRKAIKQWSDPEAREAAAHAQICRMQSNEKFSKKVSSVEDKVAEALDELGIEYERQKGIRNERGRYAALVDFYLVGSNQILEVNGTFWHSDPRLYPNGPEYQSQKELAEKYRKKIKFLKSKGYVVKEIWELDVEKNPVEAVRSATKEN